MLENESLTNQPEEDVAETTQEDINSTEEIKIEEMAIDGICGVY